MIDVATHETVARITIARPEKKNALTTAMYAAMADALTTLAQDDAVQAVVLGGGADFTAGNDLQDFVAASMGGTSFEDLPVLRFLRALRDCAKPVIAGVRGNAIGIGTTMLLHCDAVAAGSGTRFRMPFVPLGLVPEGGSSLLLPLLIGRMRANWLLMSGEFFGADEALAMGLITKVVPDEQADDAALAMAKSLAGLPPAALRETKRLIRAPYAAQVAAQMDDETAAFCKRLASDEFRAAAMKLLSR
jgi:enoyl-CoA hydratase/carnithine racemase